ncbi:MAG TPA: glycosyltransferase [Solirubrobacterales bacterium]
MRVATVAGSAHFECISAACSALDVLDQDWSSEELPHLLLIESSGLRTHAGGGGPLADEKVERAAELIAWAERQGVSTALWETALRRRIKTPTILMRMVEHLFVADPEAGEPVTERLKGRRPMQLPLAAQTVPDSVPGFGDRSDQVVFLERWPEGFTGRFREELEAILDAAADHGLVIFRSERAGSNDALPERYSSFVKPVPSASKAVEAFADSRMVVGFDPANIGRLVVPQLTMEALAAGSVVIAPNHAGIRRMFRYSALVTKDRDEANEGIERMLGSEEDWGEMSDLARKAILHAHTYSHRLATIASAARFRLVPPATPTPATAGS